MFPHRLLPTLLTITLSGTALAQCPGSDDPYEPNDTCQERVPLPLGFHPGLYVEQGDPDWFEVVVPDGEELSVEAVYQPPFGFGTAIAIEVRDPAISCDFVAASRLASVTTPDPTGTKLAWSNLTGSDKVVSVGVSVMSNAQDPCYTYDLVLSTTPDACSPFVDDALEPNDSCTTPIVLQPGFYGDMRVALEAADFFAVELPAGSRLTVDVASSPAFQSSAVFIWEDAGSCFEYVASEALATSSPTGALQAAAWLNDSALPKTVILEIRHPRFGTAPNCTTYDMLVRRGADACYLEDWLDDNDTCATAKPLADGAYSGLSIRPDDPDFYAVTIAPGATFTGQFDFDGSIGDINAALVDPTIHTCAFDPFAARLALAHGVGSTEVLQYTNTGAVPLEAVLVTVLTPFQGAPTPRCMGYAMTVAGSSVAETPIGRAFCTPAPNITGGVSTLGVDRIPALGDPQLTFEVQGLPPQAFGYLVMSPTSNESFVVGNGLLCMGAPYFRLLSTLTVAGPTGDTAMNLPWSAMPVTVAPGSTWAFQHWHRDLVAGGGGTTTNFSSGIEVVFQL